MLTLASCRLCLFVGAGVVCVHFGAFVIVWAGVFFVCGQLWVVVGSLVSFQCPRYHIRGMGACSFAVLGEPWYVGGMRHVSKGVKDKGVMGALTDSTAPIGTVPPSFAGNLQFPSTLVRRSGCMDPCWHHLGWSCGDVGEWSQR